MYPNPAKTQGKHPPHSRQEGEKARLAYQEDDIGQQTTASTNDKDVPPIDPPQG